jgi:2-dehydropantoate 2-reductase
MPDQIWPRIAVLGAGAVGCFFGGMLARTGAPVTLIGRPHHVEALGQDGLWPDTLNFRERVSVSASAAVEAARDATLVLFCVKTLDTEEAARSLAPCLSRRGGSQPAKRRGQRRTHPRGRQVRGPARRRVRGRRHDRAGPRETHRPRRPHHRRPGGHPPGSPRKPGGAFAAAGVPCVVSENIEAELWAKMGMNCAYNAVSALGRAKYGQIARHPQARELLRRAVEETATVARTAGVLLQEERLVEAAFRLGEAMGEATSSTAQDIARGKRTEIDSLNGYVARRGAELGVPTPINRTLHALVKLLEEEG